MDITQRIADILAGKYVGVDSDYDLCTISPYSCRKLAELLVSELKLRALPTTGYLDPLGFLHTSVPDGKTAKRYVQYISDWLPE